MRTRRRTVGRAALLPHAGGHDSRFWRRSSPGGALPRPHQKRESHNRTRSFHAVTEVGVEPTESPGSRPGRFSVCVLSRVRRVGCAASSGSGGRTRRSRLMRPGWTLAHPQHVSEVTKERLELSRLAARHAECRVSPSFTTWSLLPPRVTRAGIEPAPPVRETGILSR